MALGELAPGSSAGERRRYARRHLRLGRAKWEVLTRRVWYGGRKGRSAERRLERGGYVVNRWQGAPARHPRQGCCGAPTPHHGAWCEQHLATLAACDTKTCGAPEASATLEVKS